MKRKQRKVVIGAMIKRLQKLDALEDTTITKIVLNYICKNRVACMKRIAAANRSFHQRRSWFRFCNNMTNNRFRRYFRMSKECFGVLCDKIIENVGEDEFKSEFYLRQKVQEGTRLSNLMKAHQSTTGGFICGEIKVALALRLLAGGSYLDLALLFETGSTYAYTIFHDVLEKWILKDSFVKINGVDYCSNDHAMREVALQFSRTSNCVINGCIGAIDGWIVKIRRPKASDGVTNPGSFFSRKGFYGINVQCIVDKNKRILYRSILSRGAEHDSTAFKNSKFYSNFLFPKWRELAQKGFYFIGDSAYSVKSFILPPFNDVLHGSAEDNFNYFHSSARIAVECAFGEIELRWGNLWRPLQFSLKHNVNIIDACMRLHNFIVDFRQQTSYNNDDMDLFDEECRLFLTVNPDESVEIQGDEMDYRLDADGNMFAGGRPTNEDAASTQYGKQFRDVICKEIARQKFSRQKTNWYRDTNNLVRDVVE
jgi:hypothetical protein